MQRSFRFFSGALVPRVQTTICSWWPQDRQG